MSKVKLGLRSLSPEEVASLTTAIITAMNGNASFVTPNPPLLSLGTLRDSVRDKINAYLAAAAAAQLAMTERDEAVAALCAALSLEAAYVENISGGDATIIQSAGMGVRSQSSPVGQVGQVLNLVLSSGDFEGTVDAAWDATRGANSYEIQTSVDPVTATSWTSKMVASKSSATLNSMASGTRIWARVRAIGASNAPGPWSDPAVKTVP